MQIERVFIAHVEDATAVQALIELARFGARTDFLKGPDACAKPNESVLFTGIGDERRQMFPSVHVRRILMPQDEQQRGFFIPAFARRGMELFALRPLSDSHRANAQHMRNFAESMRQIYFFADGKWTGPKSSRQKRRHGHLAKIQRSREGANLPL